MRSLWQAQGQQTGARYISKFEFPYTFRGQQCQFVMTAVLGHLQNLEFGERYPLFLPPRCNHVFLSLLQLAAHFHACSILTPRLLPRHFSPLCLQPPQVEFLRPT